MSFQSDLQSSSAGQSVLRDERMLRVNSIDIACETFGNAADPAVLLVMGNSAPGLVWPDAFCARLAQGGFYVIRFDQRDTGLSTYLDFDEHPYTLDDLVDDAMGVLDSLEVRVAHVVGLSQGGVLAYRMALRAPERVASLTVMMSSPDLRPKNDSFTGAPPREGELPRPAADYVQAVIALNAVEPVGEEEVAVRFVDNFRLAKGPDSPFDEEAWLELGRAVAARRQVRDDGLTAKMANKSNHSQAQMATTDLTTAELAGIEVQVLVVHGGGDPIFPPEHAHFAASTIPGAELVVIETMGHALDPEFFGELVEVMVGFWEKVGAVR